MKRRVRVPAMLLVGACLSCLAPGLLGQQAPISEDELVSVLRNLDKRGFLGLQFVAREVEGQQDRYHFEVRSVQPGGPADRAGLQPRDVIHEVDGRPLIFRDSFDAGFFFNPVKAGQEVRLRVARGSEDKHLTVIAEELPLELARAMQQRLEQLRPALAFETFELLGRGEGTVVEISRLGSGHLAVTTKDAEGLSPLRFQALAWFLEQNPSHERIEALNAGEKASFKLRYLDAKRTFELEEQP